jgi:excinuclease ABC subunit A
MGISSISVRGARQHNLKNIHVEIPRNTLTVITGLSGSGKSSLAFDTIYAEGQRRYVETLSAYARQFLDQMERPDVDSIDGLSPSIAIEQKTTSRSPRSTVGTITEIYDYLRLLYSSIGIPHCPQCGRQISRQSADQIVQQVMALKPDERVMVLAPIVRGRKGEFKKELDKLAQQGYTRARIDGELRNIADEEIKLDKRKNHTIELVVDRLLVKPGIEGRLAASVELAMKEANGWCRSPWSAATSGCIPPNWRVRSAASTFPCWSRDRSPSTACTALARSATDWAASTISIRRRSSTTGQSRCWTAD